MPLGEPIEGNFEIALTVAFRLGQTAASNIDLECGQHEFWKREGRVAFFAHLDECIAIDAAAKMLVIPALRFDRCFPLGFAPTRLVVVTGK